MDLNLYNKSAFLFIAFIISLAVLQSINFEFIFAIAQDDFQFYTLDSKPFGLNFSEWTAKWWNWLLSISTNNNPRIDPIGIKCSVNQNDPNVWFLAQISEGHVERKCTIPVGKSIFVPVLTGECDFRSNPDIKSEKDLRDCATSGILGANVYAKIDEIPINTIERVKSPLFNYTIIKDNIFSTSSGTSGLTKAVTDGYYIFIKSLPRGNHTLDFSASGIDNPIIGTSSFSYSVKYDLEVK